MKIFYLCCVENGKCFEFMKTGLYFGSFNPIHIGHLALANYMVEFTDIEQLWFVVSPQNPFKNKKSLLTDFYRFELVEKAIGCSEKYRVSDIEFHLPKPSYTIDTLTYLKERYSHHHFVLIMGADCIPTLPRWKNYKELIDNEIYVYPRPGYEKYQLEEKQLKINWVDAPEIQISSSFIRKAIKQEKDIKYFLPQPVYKYIEKMGFYR